MLWSFGISFFRFRADRPHTPPRLNGLGNYVYMLLNEDVWEHVQNTGILMFSSVLVQLAVGSLLTLVFYRPFPGRRLVLMLVFAPMLLSTVAVGTFFNFFYDPDLRLRQRRAAPAARPSVRPAGQPGGRNDQPDHRRRLDVVAVRDADAAGRTARHPGDPARSGAGRPGNAVAALPHRDLPVDPRRAAAGGAVPPDRELQPVRPGLHHHQRRPGNLDRNAVDRGLRHRVRAVRDRQGLGAGQPRRVHHHGSGAAVFPGAAPDRPGVCGGVGPGARAAHRAAAGRGAVAAGAAAGGWRGDAARGAAGGRRAVSAAAFPGLSPAADLAAHARHRGNGGGVAGPADRRRGRGGVSQRPRRLLLD